MQKIKELQADVARANIEKSQILRERKLTGNCLEIANGIISQILHSIKNSFFYVVAL